MKTGALKKNNQKHEQELKLEKSNNTRSKNNTVNMEMNSYDPISNTLGMVTRCYSRIRNSGVKQIRGHEHPQNNLATT